MTFTQANVLQHLLFVVLFLVVDITFAALAMRVSRTELIAVELRGQLPAFTLSREENYPVGWNNVLHCIREKMKRC